MNLLNSMKWSMLGETSTKLIQPLAFIILAKLLTPDEFGIVTAGIMIISLSQTVCEAGMGKAIIQRQTYIAEAANSAFYINLMLGILISCLVFFSSEIIADLVFNDKRIDPVLQIMTLQILITCFGSIHLAMLQKRMEFKKLFWIRLSTTSLPAIVSVMLVYIGWSYWGLIAGTLIGQFSQMILLWLFSSWRPGLNFNKLATTETLRFGSWVGFTGLMIWFYAWFDSLIVGIYLGSHEMGLFRVGSQISSIIFILILGSIQPVLYSYFVKFDQDRIKMKIASIKLIKILTMISVPIGIIILQISDMLGYILLGDKWSGVGIVIGLMALVNGVSWIVGMNGEIYRAMGKPSYETFMAGFSLIIYTAFYIYSIKYGLEAFLITRVCLSILGFIVHMVFLKRLLSLRMQPIILYVLFISFLCYVVSLLITQFVSVLKLTNIVSILLNASISFGIICLVFYYLERNGILIEVKNLFKPKN